MTGAGDNVGVNVFFNASTVLTVIGRAVGGIATYGPGVKVPSGQGASRE